MKNILMKYLIPAFAVLYFSACNLTKDVDIVLPAYDPQPVVECYLEPGKPFRLLLTRSYGFFDPLGIDSSFIPKTLWNGATVTISHNGHTDTLQNITTYEFNPVKFFNYTGTNLVDPTPGVRYDLKIIVPGKGDITATTTMLKLVPIDSVVVEWDAKTDTSARARALTYITDDLSTVDYYRRMLNIGSLDSVPKQDFVSEDKLSTKSTVAFGTGYSLKNGQVMYSTIFHIDQPYYDFLRTVSLAISGNGNPFAQPSTIKSNVTGSANPLGIFTCLVYDRVKTILKK
jgi:hypothetical protein